MWFPNTSSKAWLSSWCSCHNPTRLNHPDTNFKMREMRNQSSPKRQCHRLTRSSGRFAWISTSQYVVCLWSFSRLPKLLFWQFFPFLSCLLRKGFIDLFAPPCWKLLGNFVTLLFMFMMGWSQASFSIAPETQGCGYCLGLGLGGTPIPESLTVTMGHTSLSAEMAGPPEVNCTPVHAART